MSESVDVKFRRVVRWEFTDGHDVEFIPAFHGGTIDVFVDGVFVESLPRATRATTVHAQYYYEVHCKRVEDLLLRQKSDQPLQVSAELAS
jgi:hypothetical protein